MYKITIIILSQSIPSQVIPQLNLFCQQAYQLILKFKIRNIITVHRMQIT